MSDEPPVLAEVGADGVAVVTLNRPERRNGWSPEMELAYFARVSTAVGSTGWLGRGSTSPVGAHRSIRWRSASR